MHRAVFETPPARLSGRPLVCRVHLQHEAFFLWNAVDHPAACEVAQGCVQDLLVKNVKRHLRQARKGGSDLQALDFLPTTYILPQVLA